jgi:hypothetical protein
MRPQVGNEGSHNPVEVDNEDSENPEIFTSQAGKEEFHSPQKQKTLPNSMLKRIF